MRVCHVISGIDIDNGGPPVALGGLAAAQVRAGLQVSVLSSYRFQQSHDVAADWRTKGINVRLIGPANQRLEFVLGDLHEHALPDLLHFQRDTVRRQGDPADRQRISWFDRELAMGGRPQERNRRDKRGKTNEGGDTFGTTIANCRGVQARRT